MAARRKSRRQAHKTGLIDAEIGASIGRESHTGLRRLAPVPETVAEPRVLSRYQDALIRDRTRSIAHGLAGGSLWIIQRSLRNLDPREPAASSAFTPTGDDRDRDAFVDAVVTDAANPAGKRRLG